MKDFQLLHGGFLSGTNLEEADYDTRTPMHVAVSANDPEMEEKLLFYRSTLLRREGRGRQLGLYYRSTPLIQRPPRQQNSSGPEPAQIRKPDVGRCQFTEQAKSGIQCHSMRNWTSGKLYYRLKYLSFKNSDLRKAFLNEIPVQYL
ncbi:UNVERIFIED_CONTAM: hypothetical protein FKN15_036130 [Acipenser sinensis]